MTLSVIIPAYNEEENIKKGIMQEVWSYLQKQIYPWEVIIVDDGSTDRTAELVDNFLKKHKGFSLLQISHSGKAGAVIAGFKKVLRSRISRRQTKDHIFLFTDFDQSVPISEIEKMLPLLIVSGRKFFPSVNPRVLSRVPSRHARASEPLLNALSRGARSCSAGRVARALPSAPPAVNVANRYYDIVISSRISREGAPLVRKITGYGFILLRKLFLGLPYHDTQCGFKAFRKEAAGKIMKRLAIFSGDEKQKGYAPNAGYDLEILVVAQKTGLKVAEVPVEWRYRDTNKFNVLKTSFLALKDIMHICILSRSRTKIFFSHFSR